MYENKLQATLNKDINIYIYINRCWEFKVQPTLEGFSIPPKNVPVGKAFEGSWVL